MSITDTTATATVGWNPECLDEILSNDEGRPVLFTNARILTMDPLIGTMTGADLLFVGSLVVGVGPGIITAAGDDNAIVVDCTGLTIAPAVVDTVALAGGRGHRSEYVATLTPGNTPDFLVVPDELADALQGFSPRTRQFLQLAAEGLTNPQIGERLYLSPRTVSSHLYRSFPKLGITQRSKLRDIINSGNALTDRPPTPQ
ncbi:MULTISPECIES: LuxR C-terminal-related transcriptional regulator [unclassified Streptomyces]|uniref:helix-turn-helix transcriptional regulator n=1 Tax=unclassified Streptomyces TaxID=2593676 RepID=UPI0038121602